MLKAIHGHRSPAELYANCQELDRAITQLTQHISTHHLEDPHIQDLFQECAQANTYLTNHLRTHYLEELHRNYL